LVAVPGNSGLVRDRVLLCRLSLLVALPRPGRYTNRL